MTLDDTMRLANEAHLPPCHLEHPKALKRFAELVATETAKSYTDSVIVTQLWDMVYKLGAKDEREACAKLCHALKPSHRSFNPSFYDACEAIADEIERRGVNAA